MLGVSGVPFKGLLKENFADVRRVASNLRTYTAPGNAHTILNLPRFYRETVDGVRFRDWVAALVEGRAVQNVGDSLLTTR